MKKLFKELGRIFNIDLRRNVNKISIICILVFIFMSIAVLQIGIDRYSDIKKKSNEFVNFEKRKIDRYLNFFQYGIHGFMILLKNTPIYTLFNNSSSFVELEVFIDSGFRLKINEPQSDGSIFENPTEDGIDLSWFLAVVFSGLIISWWLFTFRNTGGYLKFLLNFAGPRIVFFGVVLSRAFLILLVLVSELIISICIYLINGINIFPEISKLLTFLFTTYIVMIIFLLLGYIISTMKSTAKAVITSVVLWLIIVLLWPGILNTVFSKKARADIESRYQHQMRKLEILTSFEKLINERIKEVNKKSERIEINRSLTEKYWNEGFKQIEGLEMKMIEDIQKYVDKFQLLSIFTPVNFYKSVNNELSSMGYNEYLRFYRYSLEKFKGFVRYYIDNILYKNNPKVVSYLKDDEFIFKARSSLPKYFGAGVLFNVFIIFVLTWISYFRFMRVIFPLPVKKESFSALDLKFEKGKYYKIDYESDEDFYEQFYNVFMGRGDKFTGKLFIDTENIVTDKKQDFIYLPTTNAIPSEIKVKNLIKLVTKRFALTASDINNLKAELDKELHEKFFEEHFGKLERIEKVAILVKLAKFSKSQIIITNNLFAYVPNKTEDEFFERMFAELKSRKDNLVIELDSSTSRLPTKNDFFSMVYILDESYIERKVKS